MNYLRILLTTSLIFSSSAWAKPELTSEQYLKLTQTRVQNAKTFQELVLSADELSEKAKQDLNSWLEKNKMRAMPLNDVKLNGADIIITDQEGHKAKITFTDPKRGVIHINDQQISFDRSKTTAENLNNFIHLAGEKKSAFLFIKRAEAVSLLLITPVVIGIIAIVFHYYSQKGSPEAITEKAQELMRSAKIKEFSLECDVPDIKESELYKGVQINLRTEDSEEEHLIDRYGKVTPAATTTSAPMIDVAKDCCARLGCHELFKKSIQGLTQPEKNSGQDFKKIKQTR